MSAGSVTAAMTRTGPAQRGQTLKSIANTRALLAASIDGRPPFAKQKTTFSQDGKVAAIDPDFESRP